MGGLDYRRGISMKYDNFWVFVRDFYCASESYKSIDNICWQIAESRLSFHFLTNERTSELIFSAAPPGLQLQSSTGTHNKIHKYPLASNYFMTARCRVRWREKRKKSSSNQTSLRDKIYSSYRKNQLNRVFVWNRSELLVAFFFVSHFTPSSFCFSRAEWIHAKLPINDDYLQFVAAQQQKPHDFLLSLSPDPPRHAVQILSYSKPRWPHTISIDNLFYCRIFFSGVWSRERRKR